MLNPKRERIFYMKTKNALFLIAFMMFSICLVGDIKGQEPAEKIAKEDKSTKSIGGEEHDSDIYGVKIGMDIPTALEMVYNNAQRKPGQEKPDALKKEGKDNADIRVIYKDLPKGELQIVFAEGKVVREIVLTFKKPIQYSDLRLAYSGNIEVALGGQRYDDRYTIGYANNQKLQGVWWRDEKTTNAEYKIRVIFTSTNRLKDSQFEFQKIAQKAIFVMPGDEKKFEESLKPQE